MVIIYLVSHESGGYAGLAQLVEQLIRNEQVVGSSPIASSSEIKASGVCRGLFLYSSGMWEVWRC